MALQKDNPNTRCFAAKHLKGNRKGWVAHNRTESSVLIVSLPPCRPFLTVLFYPYRALLILWRWMPRDKHWWVQGTRHHPLTIGNTVALIGILQVISMRSAWDQHGAMWQHASQSSLSTGVHCSSSSTLLMQLVSKSTGKLLRECSMHGHLVLFGQEMHEALHTCG